MFFDVIMQVRRFATTEALMKTLAHLIQFLFALLLLHGTDKSRPYQAGGHCEDGHPHHTHQGADKLAHCGQGWL